jgi:DNA-binding CsgD family transcriptional regulator/PAS domain-containing protein
MAETIDTLETIDLLYQAAVAPELWPLALHRFALCAGGMGTALIPIVPGNNIGIILSQDLLGGRADYDREWYRHDSRVARIHRRKLTDGVYCEAELFTEEEIARDPLRQEFCRDQGMGSFAAQLVAPAPDFVIAFSVMRALERGQFERHELDTLRLLGKHAARALLVSNYLAAARGLENTLVSALGRIQCGAIIVDREWRIVLANPAAERLFGDGLRVSQGQLRAASPQHQEALARLMKSVLHGIADATQTETIALPRRNARKPLLVQAVPLLPSTQGMPTDAAALVLVIDPEQNDACSPVEALRLLGLTPAEARLAALLGHGCSRADAAAALGITEATASDTVKQVYCKLDMSRQSELVRLVGRLAVLAPPKS